MRNILDEEYLSWLDNESLRNGMVVNSLSSDKNIEILFDKINNYVKENFLIDASLYGDVYYFRHNGIGYEIGMLYGPSVIYYLKRIKIEDEDKFIDIEDVRNNRVPLKNENLTNQMKTIKKAMNELALMGIPMDIVVNEIINVSKELRRKNGYNNSK